MQKASTKMSISFRWNDHDDDHLTILSLANLRESAAWIRDVLDPLIAREGPTMLQADDVMTLHNLLIALRQFSVPLSTIRHSRIHLAVSDICGKATRWPPKLADEADSVICCLESRFGPLQSIQPPLFENGGRLWKICDKTEVAKAALHRRFHTDSPRNVDDSRARVAGDLGFAAGSWWINSMFAFRDGIIESKIVNGGVCFDEHGAYALVLSSTDEVNSETPLRFTYRCRRNDPGIFRLTSVNPRACQSVRVLRSHVLSSLWAPVAGIRYDGLHRVVGWTWKRRKKEDMLTSGLVLDFEVHFERTDEMPIEEVLKRPLAEEVDDYRTYKLVLRDQMKLQKGRKSLRQQRDEMWSQAQTRMDHPRRKSIRQIELHAEESQSLIDKEHMSPPPRLLARTLSGQTVYHRMADDDPNPESTNVFDDQPLFRTTRISPLQSRGSNRMRSWSGASSPI